MYIVHEDNLMNREVNLSNIVNIINEILLGMIEKMLKNILPIFLDLFPEKGQCDIWLVLQDRITYI